MSEQAQDTTSFPGFVDANGVEIAFEWSGSGPAVVLLHGSAANRSMWDDPGITAALNDRFRVVTLDIRGHGQSGKPDTPEGYGPELAADVVRVLDAVGVDQAHVVGYSLGALIAMDVVLRFPSRVSSVVLGGHGVLSAEAAERMRTQADEFETMPNPPPQLDVGVLVNLLRSRRAPDPAQVRAIAVPVSVLIGANDPFMPSANLLRTLLPETSIEIISGADHLTVLRDPRFLKALTEALDRSVQY